MKFINKLKFIWSIMASLSIISITLGMCINNILIIIIGVMGFGLFAILWNWQEMWAYDDTNIFGFLNKGVQK